VSGSTSVRDLTLGQEGGDLVVRLRTVATSLNGEPSRRVAGVLGDGKLHLIRVAVERDRLRILIDGEARDSAPLPKLPLSNWDTGFSLFLGNEAGGQRPWLGEIRRA